MMKAPTSLISVLSVLVLLAAAPAAHAQWAVIDVASIRQLIQEVQTMSQQLAVEQSQLAEARQEYQAFTGSRGMQNLLSGVVGNYLPTSVASLEGVLSGSGGSYGPLASSVQSALHANALLTSAELAALSPGEQSVIEAERDSVALRQGISAQALANASGRFGEVQQLINAIGTAQDPKAIFDLEARISAEQGMLQAERTKLEVLYQSVLAQRAAARQRMRERAILDIGSLRDLPPMGLQVAQP
ncbi:MAG: TrbJ/VirB5 family protein [Steroidobacteraceae bacterium]